MSGERIEIANSYELLKYLKMQNLLPNIPQISCIAELESQKNLWW